MDPGRALICDFATSLSRRLAKPRTGRISEAVRTPFQRRVRGFAVLAATAAGSLAVLTGLAWLLLEAVALPDTEATIYVSLISGFAFVTVAAALVPFGIAAKRLVTGVAARMRGRDDAELVSQSSGVPA